MKKVTPFKRISSLMLAICIIAGCITVSAAAAEVQPAAQYHPEKLITGSFGDLTIDDADTVQVPTIIIPGMTFSDFYLYDENGENMRDSNGNIMRSDMMITDSAEVSAAVKGLIKPLVKSVLFQRDKGLSESVYSFISTLFKYQKNKPDSTGVYDVRVKTFDHSQPR